MPSSSNLASLISVEKKSTSELAQKREQLVTQQSALENDQQQLNDQLALISGQLLSLQVQLPPATFE